ncbi:M56 family metallopeptidase [Bacteroides sp. OttesenSCG-928-D19]|nr:M56 family metallopeptidase [Bacteroides sp. OttesenSCG-928-D19]
MTPIVIYFLKVNIAIALFYAFYRLFFYRDTFFQWRRGALLFFLAVSFFYPFINIQDWVKEQEPIMAMTDIYADVILPELTMDTAEATELPASINWHKIVAEVPFYLYWGVAVVLFLRILLQFIGLIKLRFQTKTGYVQEVKIRLSPNTNSPFSFFKWIFIDPAAHTESELKEIVTHEQTHARQWHSIDVVIGELFCIICWFNPFSWLIKREIRANLEYLADRKVLETGYDSKSYQYHLLGLTHKKQVATLYNNFNVLPLKNRIKMMNKRKTKEIGRAKYFLFPALAALLLIVSNVDAVARTAERMVQDAFGEIEMGIEQNDPVYELAATMPQFPGGHSEFMKYLNQTIKYPVNAQMNKKQGRVIAQFIVNKDGTLTSPKIMRSIDPELDAEAIRIINEMPKWIPGKNEEGEIIRVRYTIPIQFRLNGVKEETKQDTKDPSRAEEAFVIVMGRKVYEMAEKMPEFPGGHGALMSFINENIQYPEEAKANGTQGRVVAQFLVETDGTIVNPTIMRSINSEMDAEAIRVIKAMPKWIPGEHKGEKVPVKFTVPISFRIQ